MSFDPISASAGAASSAIGWFAGEESARRQRKWQDSFYRTRHQWQVKDLKEAGLNPVLSAHSAPSTASGSMGHRAEDIAKSSESYSAAGQKRSMTALAKEQLNTQTQLTKKASNEAELAHWNSKVASVQAYKDHLLSRAYEKPIVQSTAPILRAFSESGLPASSAMQLFKLFPAKQIFKKIK